MKSAQRWWKGLVIFSEMLQDYLIAVLKYLNSSIEGHVWIDERILLGVVVVVFVVDLDVPGLPGVVVIVIVLDVPGQGVAEYGSEYG